MKLKIRKLAFQFSSEKPDSYEYRHINLVILAQRPYASESGEMERLINIRWQSDRTNGFSKWYGLDISVASPSSTYAANSVISEHFAKAAKIIKSLLSDNSNNEPSDILKRLAELKIERVAYDGRLSAYVTQAEMPDASLVRFVDDYNQTGNPSGATVGGLATDSDHAKTVLAKGFADYLVRRPYESVQNQFAAWIAAGRPVLACDSSMWRPAKFEPLDSILNPESAVAV